CMDFGFHVCLSRALRTCGNAEECLQRSLQQECAALQQRAADLDSRADKQRFLEGNNAAFMVPRKFSFQPHRGDEEPQRVSVEHPIEEELDQRLRMLNKRLTSLCTENDEIWKTLETAERSLLDMIAAKECDCSALFEDRNGVKQPETLALKLRADKQETEDFYLEKFRDYTLGCNVVARLQAKAELMRAALGKENEASCGATPSPAHTPQAPGRPPPPRKKRIGRQATRGQPKLFEGSLEEYLEATDQEVPLVIRSCVRVINLYGLHHQGVFRVSGSQVEINHFRDCFERASAPPGYEAFVPNFLGPRERGSALSCPFHSSSFCVLFLRCLFLLFSILQFPPHSTWHTFSHHLLLLLRFLRAGSVAQLA
ncbi:putative slit-robo Rho GTPase activating protein 1,3, partial [Ixodes scapularis]